MAKLRFLERTTYVPCLAAGSWRCAVQHDLVATGRVVIGSIRKGLAPPETVAQHASLAGHNATRATGSSVVSRRVSQQAVTGCCFEEDVFEQHDLGCVRATAATERGGCWVGGVEDAVWERTAYEGGVIPRSKAQASRSAGDLQQQLVQHFTGELQPQCPPWQGYGVSSSRIPSPEVFGEG